MTAREATLARIRAALGGPAAGAEGIPRGYRVRSDLDPGGVSRLFAERVADYRATVHRADAGGLSALLARILEEAGAARVVVPAGLPQQWLADVPEHIGVVVDDGALSTAQLDGVDAVVTGCAVAIAETGTVVLDAGPDQGRRLVTLVPDHHVCVVAAEQIVATVPEGLARLDPRRPLTMISGPSATSDIELDRVEGVHGPRNLDVVIVAAA